MTIGSAIADGTSHIVALILTFPPPAARQRVVGFARIAAFVGILGSAVASGTYFFYDSQSMPVSIMATLALGILSLATGLYCWGHRLWHRMAVCVVNEGIIGPPSESLTSILAAIVSSRMSRLKFRDMDQVVLRLEGGRVVSAVAEQLDGSGLFRVHSLLIPSGIRRIHLPLEAIDRKAGDRVAWVVAGHPDARIDREEARRLIDATREREGK